MNVQRWLALGIVGGIVALLATRDLWLPTSGDEAPELSFPTAIPSSASGARPASLTGAEAQATTAALRAIPLPTFAVEAAGDVMEAMEANEEVLPEGPFTIKAGDFVEFDALHGGTGIATIYEAPDGNRYLRLDPFTVTDGPDLRVLLASHPAPRTVNELLSGEVTDLGELQGAGVENNYLIPLTVNLEQVESVVIYSRPFDIIFSIAHLNSVETETTSP